jgi:hypothetical protein
LAIDDISELSGHIQRWLQWRDGRRSVHAEAIDQVFPLPFLNVIS